MERTKYFITILLLFAFIAAKSTYRERIYQAYINGKMNDWKMIVDEMEKVKAKNNAFILELIDYQYGYIAWCIGNKKMDEAKKYLGFGDSNIEILWKQNYQLSQLNSYKSAFYGYKIGLNKIQAPILGSKSLNCANESIKLDKNNPMPHIQLGNSEFYMPAMFGGSKQKALQHFKNAELLMEKNPNELTSNWNYLSLLVMISNCHKELKQYGEARQCLSKALIFEPGFLWVRNELLPEIEKLMQKEK